MSKVILMSKQEIYAWTSLGFTVAIFGYYLISAFGLPTGIENYSEHITNLIWKVIGITVLIELILELSNSAKIGGVQQDERDILITSKGLRNAYYFLMVSIITLVVHILINDYFSQATGERLFLAKPYVIFHVLVFILFIANITKSATQIFYYQWGSYNA